MLPFSRRQPQPIGVDLGCDSVKLMQLELADESLRVLAADRLPMPRDAGPSALDRVAVGADLVRQALRDGEFRGRSAVVAIPSELIHVKNLRLPVMPAAELASAVEYEARTIFPFVAEGATVRHVVAGEVRQGSDSKIEVIVFAVPSDPLDRIVESLHHAGLVVDSLDLESCALYRTIDRFVRRRDDEHEVTVLLDVGQHRSRVVIGRGRELSFVKTIDLGGRDLDSMVARKLAISEDEAKALRMRCSAAAGDLDESVRRAVADATRPGLEQIGRELSLCLRYFSVTFRGQRPSRVRVVGGVAHDPQACVVFGTGLTIPVEVGRPLSGVECSSLNPSLRTQSLCEWAVPFGLALRRVQSPLKPGPGNALAGPRTTTAEVIDLQHAIDDTARPSPEVAHA
jgi:type IV pilus assembly protein PilM